MKDKFPLVIKRDGQVVFLDKEGQEISTEKLKKVDRKAVRGQLQYYKALLLFGVKESPLKVYVDIGDTVYCFEFDDVTGEYLGQC